MNANLNTEHEHEHEPKIQENVVFFWKIAHFQKKDNVFADSAKMAHVSHG